SSSAASRTVSIFICLTSSSLCGFAALRHQLTLVPTPRHVEVAAVAGRPGFHPGLLQRRRLLLLLLRPRRVARSQSAAAYIFGYPHELSVIKLNQHISVIDRSYRSSRAAGAEVDSAFDTDDRPTAEP